MCRGQKIQLKRHNIMSIQSSYQHPSSTSCQDTKNQYHSLQTLKDQNSCDVQLRCKDDEKSTDDHLNLISNPQSAPNQLPQFFRDYFQVHNFPDQLFFILKRAAKQVLRKQKKLETSEQQNKVNNSEQKGENNEQGECESQEEYEDEERQSMLKNLLKIINNDELIQKIDQQGQKQVNEELGHRLKLIQQRLRQQNRNVERNHQKICELNTQIYFLHEEIRAMGDELSNEIKQLQETFTDLFDEQAQEEEQVFHDFNTQQENIKQQTKKCVFTEKLTNLQKKKAELLEMQLKNEQNEISQEQKERREKMRKNRILMVEENSNLLIKNKMLKKRMSELVKNEEKNQKQEEKFKIQIQNLKYELAKLDDEIGEKRMQRMEYEKTYKNEEDEIPLDLSLSIRRRSSLSIKRQNQHISPFKRSQNIHISPFKNEVSKKEESQQITTHHEKTSSSWKLYSLIIWFVINLFMTMFVLQQLQEANGIK